MFRRILAAASLTGLGLLGVAAPTAEASPAAVRAADPCAVQWSGVPGITSFTAEITSNPCGIRVRSYVDCGGNLGSNVVAYGPYITGTGPSKAQCDRVIPLTTSYGITV